MNKHSLLFALTLLMAAITMAPEQSYAQSAQRDTSAVTQKMMKRVTPAQRQAAAAKRALLQGKPAAGKPAVRPMGMTMPMSGTTPDYFGMPNWANSPLPSVDPTTGAITGGIRKFVDTLPGLGAANANNLGQYIPVAVPDTTTYPGSDYYEIELVEYSQKMHSDLPLTKLRGYVQTNTSDPTVSVPHYMGPVIIAHRDRPVRVKFTNKLPIGMGGDLFIPVDTTTMGAGMGPFGMNPPIGDMNYTQNRATLHLHGGHTPWISDGTPHQWVTPAGEVTSYPKGVSVQNVPDMPDPGDGSMTFFYTNQQSARLMFYHDHAYGITRLNVYAGEAAGYIIQDDVEQNLVASGLIPAEQVPLIIQDKTFVPDAAQLASTDPTWDSTKWGGFGQLWFPHVYMPNQNPYDLSGANPYGRWDYGPWFWPPLTPAAGLKHGEVPNPYYDAVNAPWEPPMMPGTPNVSMVMEAFMDTPVVNGTAYPYFPVQRKAYRFRILNACNDRYLNLQLYYAKSNASMWNPDGTLNDANAGEVPMVPAVRTPGYPATWPTDGRDGGVPDPTAAGPNLIQIGTEGGMLPAPVVIPSQPVGYNYNRRDIVVLNVADHALFLGPAERADVIVDFSQVPEGSKIILYNDSPAPVPAFDPRIDYYTGDPDQTSTGGAPTTLPGYGPNTRTILQFQVMASTPDADYISAKLPALQTALPTAFAASQPPIIVPEAAYGPAYGQVFPNKYVRIQDTSFTFTPNGSTTPLTIPLQPKAIQELFELDYGRMNSTLGVELPLTNFLTQTTIPLGYIDPATEILNDSVTPMSPVAGDGTQLWKITHNGVDTHAIHFHLFDVQLVNRVGWDGAIRPPDANELGWKDTVRMNPLEDCIVALRPTAPELPFGIPDSIRPLDPTMPIGSTDGFTGVDPTTGNPMAVTNQLFNFGWEYVWHCHLLGHEEMDMMRPVKFNVARTLPQAPVVSGAQVGGAVSLTWTDGTPVSGITTWGNPANEIGYHIERATTGAYLPIGTALANATSYTDPTADMKTSYNYRVIAFNAAGESVSAPVSVGPPAAPSGLTATAIGPFQVKLDWTKLISTQTGLRVERATGAGTFAPVATIAPDATTYTDTTPVDATAYSYRLIAFNTAGDSLPSNTATATTTLAAPSNAVAAMSAQPPLTITVSWVDNSVSNTGFTVQRATNSAFTAGLTSYTVSSGAATSFTDNTSLALNITYYYRVCSTMGAVVSAWSNALPISTTLPAAPTNLTATGSLPSLNPPTVTLGWLDNATNEGGYVIQRATNSGFTQGLTTFNVGPNTTAFTDNAVLPTTRYYYRVQAINGAGVSGWSNSVNLTTAGLLPAAPTNLVASVISTNYAILSWTDNAVNETGFYVYRSTDNGTTWSKVGTTSTNSTLFRNNNLTTKTTYMYRVQAYNASGVSALSNTLTLTTK